MKWGVVGKIPPTRFFGGTGGGREREKKAGKEDRRKGTERGDPGGRGEGRKK